jgi:hypothetical protein
MPVEGAWGLIERAARDARGLHPHACPITKLAFLGAQTEWCLHGEAEYRFRVTYQRDPQFTKLEAARAQRYLLRRLDCYVRERPFFGLEPVESLWQD